MPGEDTARRQHAHCQGKRDDRPAQEDRREHVRMNRGARSGIGCRRDKTCGHDSAYPLQQKYKAEGSVGTAMNLVHLPLHDLFGSNGSAGWARNRAHLRTSGELRAQPNTGVLRVLTFLRLTISIIAASPSLSPSWARAAVMPPEKTRFPCGSYNRA